MTRKSTYPAPRARRSRRLTLVQQAAISREQVRKAFFRCEQCGARHGTLIALPSGAYFRYELVLHHMNGKPWDYRRANLRVWCQVCRGESARPRGAVVLRKAAPTHPAPFRA